MTDSNSTDASSKPANAASTASGDTASQPSTASLYGGMTRADGSKTDGFSIPKMGAEVGYQVVSEDEVPPFRASGLICLVLGLLGFSALVAWQMLILPIAAIVFGVIAMRPWQGRRPAGTTAAVIGLVLASGFLAAGFTIPFAKKSTMGGQAEYFAREFLELVGNGDIELASELQKEARNRQVKEMNLIKQYQEDLIAREQSDEGPSNGGATDQISAAGPDIPWELAQSPRVFVKYNTEKVDTLWVDPTGEVGEKVHVELQWTPNEETGKADWHVTSFHFHRELIVAPSIL